MPRVILNRLSIEPAGGLDIQLQAANRKGNRLVEPDRELEIYNQLKNARERAAEAVTSTH